MSFYKISLFIIRVTTICLIIIVTVIMVSHQPKMDKLVKKIITPSILITDKEWSLELDKSYTLCGHVESQYSKYPSKELLQTAIRRNPTSQLKTIKEHLQIYSMQITAYCSSCQKNRFLGIKNNQVVIIRGTPQKPGPLLEKTNIKIEVLPKLESDDLKKGIPFRNEKEKLQIIEGLSAD